MKTYCRSSSALAHSVPAGSLQRQLRLFPDIGSSSPQQLLAAYKYELEESRVAMWRSELDPVVVVVVVATSPLPYNIVIIGA